MIPTWWQFLLLSLAAYRITRLLGWDDLPPVLRTRRWLLGEYWLAEKDSPAEGPYYDRPFLAAMFQCAFCLGWWVSLCWWAAWTAWPHATIQASIPFALAATVGLIAKRLDP